MGRLDDGRTLPAIEVAPPDIEPFRRGNTGVDFVHRLDSGRPGPAVAIAALTHGNEICGATAAIWLLSSGLRPTRGVLTIWFGNVAAFRRLDAANLERTRLQARSIDHDLNRVWSEALLKGPERSVELDRARALLPFVEAQDALLDIHSTTLSERPFLVYQELPRARALADALGYPAAHVLIDGVKHSGVGLFQRGRFSRPDALAASIVVECGTHFARAAGALAIQSCLRFLDHCGIVDRDAAAAHMTPLPREATRRYAVREVYRARHDDARFVRPFLGFEELARGEPILVDGGVEVVAPFDRCAVLMPWASVRKGREMVTIAEIVP